MKRLPPLKWIAHEDLAAVAAAPALKAAGEIAGAKCVQMIEEGRGTRRGRAARQ
jgi:hypothetical protein